MRSVSDMASAVAIWGGMASKCLGMMLGVGGDARLDPMKPPCTLNPTLDFGQDSRVLTYPLPWRSALAHCGLSMRALPSNAEARRCCCQPALVTKVLVFC
jgi:hypothetical protein